jgi:MFS family permease
VWRRTIPGSGLKLLSRLRLIALVTEKKDDNENDLNVPEITEANRADVHVPAQKFGTFPALSNKNYRFFFFGQAISVIGTWMQIVAQAWLVLQFTTSPVVLGVIAAMATIPSLLFSLFGGVIVDTFNKKKILYITQVANMTFAIALGVLTYLDIINLVMIGAIAFLMGTVNAVDAPARQAFVSQIVSKDQLPSAIALNSSLFNAARAIGPAVSGILIYTVGTAMAFILNGVSFLFLIIALSFIQYNEVVTRIASKALHAIRDGVKYSFTHPLIRVLIIFTGMLSIFGWSYSTIVPLIAKQKFHLDAKGLGYMYTATGLGSLLATYFVGAFSRKVSPTIYVIGGNVLFSVSLILFSLTTQLSFALPLLFFMGMGLLSQAATINTLIQTSVRNELRGRVMSLYVLMFLGFAPFGNFEVGFLSEHFSIRTALIVNAIIILSFGILLFSYRNRIRAAYRTYNQSIPS